MSKLAIIDYFLLLALMLTTVLIVRSGIANVTSAIRTGRLRGRGAVYNRHAQPGMFWLAVVFWVADHCYDLRQRIGSARGLARGEVRRSRSDVWGRRTEAA